MSVTIHTLLLGVPSSKVCCKLDIDDFRIGHDGLVRAKFCWSKDCNGSWIIGFIFMANQGSGKLV